MVKAEILGYDLDAKGNIIIKSCFSLDGVDIPSDYPPMNGRYYYVTRYDAINFYQMTEEQIKTRVLADVEAHVNKLIRQSYIKKKNLEIFHGSLDSLVGSTLEKEAADLVIQQDAQGTPIVLTVKTDGTAVEKSVTIENPIK